MPGTGEGKQKLASTPPKGVPVTRVTPRVERRARPGLLLAVLLLGGGAVSWAVISRPAAADPHYVKARKLVTDHERGREPATLDYEAVPYEEALAELTQVPAASVSAEPAERLAGDIRAKQAAQRERLRVRRQDMETRQEMRRQRDEAFFEAQRRARLNPKTSYPECEHEETPAHSGKKH